MTTGGWVIMIVSVSSVLALVSYCLVKVLTLPPVEVEEHLRAPLDIETGDTTSAD